MHDMCYGNHLISQATCDDDFCDCLDSDHFRTTRIRGIFQRIMCNALRHAACTAVNVFGSTYKGLLSTYFFFQKYAKNAPVRLLEFRICKIFIKSNLEGYRSSII